MIAIVVPWQFALVLVAACGAATFAACVLSGRAVPPAPPTRERPYLRVVDAPLDWRDYEQGPDAAA